MGLNMSAWHGNKMKIICVIYNWADAEHCTNPPVLSIGIRIIYREYAGKDLYEPNKHLLITCLQVYPAADLCHTCTSFFMLLCV